jgi:hypothetical protein
MFSTLKAKTILKFVLCNPTIFAGLTQNQKKLSDFYILDFEHRNLGFEPGTSDLFDRFFRYFFE